MRYYVTIGTATCEVDITGDTLTLDGRQIDAALLKVPGTPLRRLTLNGQSHRVVGDAGGSRGEWHLHIDGVAISAEVVDERTRAIRALTVRTGVPQGPKPVRAPMPGMIARVDVQLGDKVQAGQGVVIMEAMKMENELKADAAGTVSNILVTPGTAVEKGAILIEFSADG